MEKPAATVADLILRGAALHPDRPFLVEDRGGCSYAEYLERCRRIAAVLGPYPPGPLGLALGAGAEFWEVAGAAALTGRTLVPAPPGDTQTLGVCAVAVVGDGARAGAPNVPALVASPGWAETLQGGAGGDAAPPAPADLFALLPTAGTTGAPKLVRWTHARALAAADRVAVVAGLHRDDRAFLAGAPTLAASILWGWLAALARGASIAPVRRPSARRFLSDVRVTAATYLPYSGTALATLLREPERPTDAGNPLRICYGDGGSWRAAAAFARRFDCRVVDAYEQTEGAIAFVRHPSDPPGSAGRPAPDVRIEDEHGALCPAARFDASGAVANLRECAGEIVGRGGASRFEGYADGPGERVRGEDYRSGDLGYLDERGFCYVTGRAEQFVRLAGGVAPARQIEEVLDACPGVRESAVYPVPDPLEGDRVMCAVEAESAEALDPQELWRFLGARDGFSPTWIPSFVLVAEDLPRGPSGRVSTGALAREKFLSQRGTIYWHAPGESGYRALTADDLRSLRATFASAGRSLLLEV